MDKLASNLKAFTQLKEAEEWIPLAQLVGRKQKQWLLAYGHAPTIKHYAPRLAFHRGSEPVKSVTTTNYFEIILQEPEAQLPAMAETLSQFLDDGDYPFLPLGTLWKFVLWFAGGKILDSTLWVRRNPLGMEISLYRAGRELFYGLVRQPKHGGLLTIVESKVASFSGFAASGSEFGFNWISLTLESGREMAMVLKDFQAPTLAPIP